MPGLTRRRRIEPIIGNARHAPTNTMVGQARGGASYLANRKFDLHDIIWIRGASASRPFPVGVVDRNNRITRSTIFFSPFKLSGIYLFIYLQAVSSLSYSLSTNTYYTDIINHRFCWNLIFKKKKHLTGIFIDSRRCRRGENYTRKLYMFC